MTTRTTCDQRCDLVPTHDRCTAAASKDHVACLRQDEGCPWDAHTCAVAASNGRLECLRHAHEQGCPWDERTCLWAAECGSLDCLRYSHEHGCPWDAGRCCQKALASGRAANYECFVYVLQRASRLTDELMGDGDGSEWERAVRHAAEFIARRIAPVYGDPELVPPDSARVRCAQYLWDTGGARHILAACAAETPSLSTSQTARVQRMVRRLAGWVGRR